MSFTAQHTNNLVVTYRNRLLITTSFTRYIVINESHGQLYLLRWICGSHSGDYEECYLLVVAPVDDHRRFGNVLLSASCSSFA
jgi:hypothetical protein